MTLRIGDLLVMAGCLTESERDDILRAQRDTARPFGAIAEDLFGVDPRAVENAWATQFADAAARVDLDQETVDPHVLETITPRQAWQFRVLPLRFEAGELRLCSTRQHLPRVLKFAATHLARPAALVVTDPVSLGKALERWYPIAGFDADQFASEFASLLRRERGEEDQDAA